MSENSGDTQTGSTGDSRPGGGLIAVVTLAALGVLLLAAFLVLRFVVYPSLAIAPIDQDSVTKATAPDATIFDIGTLKPITTDLSLESKTIGDVKASEKAGGDIRVWKGETEVKSGEGTVRSTSSEITPFDGVTAEAVDCCGASMQNGEEEPTPVTREGLVWKFPIDTQKQDYKVWDDTLAATVTASYTATYTVEGMEVYAFKAEAPDTVVGSRAVPGLLLGSPASATVQADSHYQNTTTFYVEPNTGVIIDRGSDQKEWLEAGGAQLITTEASFSYTDEQVAANVDHYQTKATLLGLVHVGALWILLALGVVLLGVAGWMGLRRSRR